MVKSYQMAKMSLNSTETHGLKVLMAQRELSVSALAVSCDVESVTLSNQLSKNFPSQRLRLIVEHVLKLPIWSTSADFSVRQHLIACCGFDPYQLTAAAALPISRRVKNSRPFQPVAAGVMS